MSYYVYELRDPRSGAVFYIGKGKGRRIDAHEKEAKKGVHSPKCDLIREIWDASLEVEKKILARYAKEEDAYAAERDLIADIGLDSLTNISPGGIWIPRGKLPSRSKWSLGSLMQLAPNLARALREMGEQGRFVINLGGERDITHLLMHTIRGLISDCGEEAVKREIGRFGVQLLIS